MHRMKNKMVTCRRFKGIIQRKITTSSGRLRHLLLCQMVLRPVEPARTVQVLIFISDLALHRKKKKKGFIIFSIKDMGTKTCG